MRLGTWMCADLCAQGHIYDLRSRWYRSKKVIWALLHSKTINLIIRLQRGVTVKVRTYLGGTLSLSTKSRISTRRRHQRSREAIARVVSCYIARCCNTAVYTLDTLKLQVANPLCAGHKPSLCSYTYPFSLHPCFSNSHPCLSNSQVPGRVEAESALENLYKYRTVRTVP